MSEVRPGQRLQISAGAWNRQQRMLAAYERGDLSSRRDPTGGAFDPSRVLVQNKTGATRDQFEIVKLGNPAILPSTSPEEFRQQVLFEGIAPTDDCQFAVLLAPASVDAVVEAKIAGVVQTQITKTTSSPTAPFKLKASAGVYELVEAPTGVAGQALWAETGTGTKWAYVSLGQIGGGSDLIVGKTDASIAVGASGTVSVYTGTPGAETDTGDNITAFNTIATIGLNKWCICAKINGYWYLVNGRC